MALQCHILSKPLKSNGFFFFNPAFIFDYQLV